MKMFLCSRLRLNDPILGNAKILFTAWAETEEEARNQFPDGADMEVTEITSNTTPVHAGIVFLR